MSGAERFRAVIVDDEPLARSTLRILLGADPEVAVVGECGGGLEAVRQLPQLAPDILFLDVQMPGLDGFEVLRRARPAVGALVFVTAHDEFALRAFDEQALDYLLKPFDDERFARALGRAKQRVRQLRGAPGPERLVVRDGTRLHLIDVGAIAWIEAQDYCVEIHAGGRTHLVRQPLRDLEAQLDPRRFFRVHRSALVNLRHVNEVVLGPQGDPAVLLADGTRVPLSRGRRGALLALLGV